MITVLLNKQEKYLDTSITLSLALDTWGYKLDMPFAVTINKKLIIRGEYKTVYLSDGDIVDIIFPMQGG